MYACMYVAAAHVTEHYRSTAMESKMPRRYDTRKQHSSIPTSSASPSNSLDLRSAKDVSSKQGSKISSRTGETETKAPKRSHPASSFEGDPFAFNEEDGMSFFTLAVCIHTYMDGYFHVCMHVRLCTCKFVSS